MTVPTTTQSKNDVPVDVNLVGEPLASEQYEPSKAHRDEAAQIVRAEKGKKEGFFAEDPNNKPRKQVAKSTRTANVERDKMDLHFKEWEILEKHVERFFTAKERVMTSSKQSTLDILTLARVVFDYSKAGVKSKEKNKEFRERCGLLSASKHTQFKKIGSVSRVLGEHAELIPTGWVSLYAIADYLEKGAKEDKSEDNPNPVLDEEEARKLLADLFGEHEIIVTKKDGKEDKETATFDAISNQMEVRKIINTKLGKTNNSSKSGPEAPGVLCAIDVSKVTDTKDGRKQLEGFLAELSTLAKKYPFFTEASFNRTLEKQVETNPKLASEVNAA